MDESLGVRKETFLQGLAQYGQCRESQLCPIMATFLHKVSSLENLLSRKFDS